MKQQISNYNHGIRANKGLHTIVVAHLEAAAGYIYPVYGSRIHAVFIAGMFPLHCPSLILMFSKKSKSAKQEEIPTV
jgi:hypothetical protein